MTRGITTTAASKMLRTFVPPYDATVVGRLEAAGRRRDGQDQLRRVRDGIVDRELRVRTVAQSVESGSHLRRFERRIGRRGRRRLLADRARLRYRRLDPAARVALRHRRPEADLRPRLAIRVDRVCVLARSDRADGAHGARRGDRAVGPRRRRSVRLDGVAGTGRRLRRRAHRRHPRRAPRRSAQDARAGRGERRSRLLLRRARHSARARRRARRHRAASRTVCDRHLLRRRDRRSQLEPRALRRRALWISRRRRARSARDVREDAKPGVWPRSEAPHHARHRTC